MDMLNCDRGQVINGNVIEQGGYITVATGAYVCCSSAEGSWRWTPLLGQPDGWDKL